MVLQSQNRIGAVRADGQGRRARCQSQLEQVGPGVTPIELILSGFHVKSRYYYTSATVILSMCLGNSATV